MKVIVSAGVLVLVMAILVAGRESLFSLAEGVQHTVEVNTVEVEVLPEWAENEEAVQAAKDVIQRQEWEAELEELETQRGELNSRIEELEKNLGTY